MVEAMFALLECARDTGEYSYFHFLSGNDMPIKDNEIVFNFFENSYPQNFIDILDFENVNKTSYFYETSEMIEERVKYYYPHMDI
ncbi:beta-1,6-N-acetylglucosaminyltransferase, partial [Mycobacterium kansasii]